MPAVERHEPVPALRWMSPERTRSSDRVARVAALGGVIGPATFIGAWAVGSMVSPGYSIADDAISRLAAVGAGTRSLMTIGFVGFGIGLPLYAIALRRVAGGAAWMAAAATGLATLAVAAVPLDQSATSDRWHGVWAVCGYITLAATPLLAVRPLLQRGSRGLARLGIASGAASGICLLLSGSRLPTGLLQRAGLTAADIWIVASAIAIVSGRLRTDPSGSAA